MAENVLGEVVLGELLEESYVVGILDGGDSWLLLGLLRVLRVGILRIRLTLRI